MYNQQQISNRKLKQEKEKAENQKMFLETKTEIKTYLAWKQLPQLEQIRIKEEWDNYYGKVRNTLSSKGFFKMREAWKAKNVGKIKELANKARKRLEQNNFQLIKPMGIDPWEFSHGVYAKYNAINDKIRLINKQLTGVRSVEKIFNPSNY